MSFVFRTFMLLAYASTVYSSEEFFNITRTTALNQEDQFVIPSSMCNPSSRLECRRFHKRSYIHARKCECTCPYDASTFGFDSGSWTCLKNTVFRDEKAGCAYLFQSEYHNFPLQVLETGRWQRRLRVLSDSCKIDISSSRYLQCDGSWSRLSFSEKSDIFKLRLLHDDDSFSVYGFEITEKASLAGRIIKLQINCAPAAKSSCFLFKIAGTIPCPVDPTRKSNVATDGQIGGSSGTVAAVVIVIIIIIIVAAIIGFIIWKRKRGENVWLMDRVSSIATMLRNRTSAPAVNAEEQQEQIYAEILDHQVQPGRSQNTPPAASSSRSTTRTAIPLSGGIVAAQSTDNDDGYAVPTDSPEYKELEDPNEQNTGDDGSYAVPSDSPEYKELEDRNERNTGDDGSYAVPSDSPEYKELEDRNERNTGNDDETMKTENNSELEDSREAADNHEPGPGLPAAADDRYVTKQRRKPPSPPQKENDTQERGLYMNDDTSVKEGGEEGPDKIHDYEHLKDENRHVYQPLDRKTMKHR